MAAVSTSSPAKSPLQSAVDRLDAFESERALDVAEKPDLLAAAVDQHEMPSRLEHHTRKTGAGAGVENPIAVKERTDAEEAANN